MLQIKNVIYENLSINDKSNIIHNISYLLNVDSPENIDNCSNFFEKWFLSKVPGDKYTFIALDDDKLVGVVRFWSTPYLGNKWYVEGLEVLSSYRRKGIGSKLISTAITFLSEQGIKKLWSNIKNSNVASIKLHESMGFKVSSYGACSTYGSYYLHNNCYSIDLTSNPRTSSHIRPYNENDFEKVLELYKEEKWISFCTRIDDAKNAFNNSALSFVYEINSEIVGFIRGFTDCHITMFISELLVRGSFRNKKIGTGLLDKCHELYPSCRIELLTDDATDFYRKIGFNQEFVGMRKKFLILKGDD